MQQNNLVRLSEFFSSELKAQHIFCRANQTPLNERFI